MILFGKELSQLVKDQVKAKSIVFERLSGRKPCLAVVLVGDNPASQTYVKGKKKACDEVGFDHRDISFESTITQDELLDCVGKLCGDSSVDGILVQLPLPDHIDENTIINAISPEKDVDGFTPSNIGKLLIGQKSLVACTPKGILRMLDHYGIETVGKDVCILGRSNIVGKPMAALLVQRSRSATVTVCNSFTPDIKPYVRRADIIISAVGRMNIVTADMVKDGAVVIDVGMNRIADSTKKSGYRLCGDVDFENIQQKASAITPVPGGVGLMTIAMLMENTLEAACERLSIDMESL